MKKKMIYKINNLNISTKAFSISKSGNTDKENEDALCFNLTNDDNTFTAAIADGSTEGYLSKEWAKTLVRKFCTIDYNFNHISNFHDEFYNSCTHHWSKYFTQYIKKRNSSNNPIQWFEEPGLTAGAFSSITGANIFNQNNKSYAIVYSIGDSCLFNISNEKIVNSFPIESPDEFNNSPLLLPSNNNNLKNLKKFYKTTHIEIKHNDKFLFMTDAIACWFLKENLNQTMPWKVLNEINEQEHFYDFVNNLRKNKQIKNDDTSIIELNFF